MAFDWQNDPDASAIYTQIYRQAWEQLKPIVGDSEGANRGVAIANQAMAVYAAAKDAGEPSGVARDKAVAAGNAAIDQVAVENKQAAPNASTAMSGQPGAPGSPTFGSSMVTGGDKAYGIDQFRQGVANQQADLASIGGATGGGRPNPVPGATAGYGLPGGVKPGTGGFTSTMPTGGTPGTGAVNDPNARDTFKAVTAERVAAPQVTAATVDAPQLGDVAYQGKTMVGSTTLDTSQADQARQDQLDNNAQLKATSLGQGAAQQAYDARAKLAALRAGQQANGLAQQARGSERKGALLQGQQNAAQANIEGQIANEAQSAGERMGAATALTGAIAGTRTTDVSVATTKAQLDADRSKLQAQLDAARAANNQAAINDFTKKLADLDARAQEFNATASNTVSTGNADRTTTAAAGNADRTLTAGTSNNAGALAANIAGSNQDVAQADLKLRINKAIQDSAQGLLNEETRQANLDIARKGLAQAEARLHLQISEQERAAATADRDFFMKAIAGLATTVATVAPLVASDERVKTNIEKVSPKDFSSLAKALRSSWSTFDYEDGLGLPEGKQTSGMAQAIEKTKLGKLIVKERPDGVKLVDFGKGAAILASYLVSEKKKQAAQ